MGTVSKPNTFTPNTIASPSEVNDNFDTIYNEFNGNISSNNLTDGAVTTAKINDSAVSTAKLTDSAVTTAKINDGAVTNAKLATGTGEPGGAWTSWTPTWTNVTIGNATVNGAYKQIGKTVHWTLWVQWGNTTSASGSQIFSLPVTASSNFNHLFHPLGFGVIEDTGTGSFFGMVVEESTNTARIISWGSGGTYVGSDATASSSVPMTWATNDRIKVSGTYEAA
jgi:hypothetical protein